MENYSVKVVLKEQKIDDNLVVKGWVRNKRGSKNVSFITVNDGSCLTSLQVVADHENFADEVLKDVTTGACVVIEGTLRASAGKGQAVELEATKIEVVGPADPETYPLQPKKHSLEFLREIAHLRPRTNTFGAIYRVRHALIFAVHKFFNERGFLNVHTPIITASDAEGAGETFRVTTLDPANPPKNEDGEVDYKEDFFGRESNLTVSGQLEAELGALGLSKVYTFGPTFRAENSNTTRHLAEFWMIEPEVAFNDINDNMKLAEDMLQSVVQYALDNCAEDLEFLDKRIADEEKSKPAAQRAELGLIERLKFVVQNEFQRLTYTEAIDILRNCKPNKKKKFQYVIDGWGADLHSEHERYLVEKHFKKPVILFNYPKDIKAFYMRMNDDDKTVAAMDILFPGIGEIVGGSQREERLDVLESRCIEMGIDPKELYWYMDTRKYGSCIHSGYGLGFERLVLFVTGMGNIRDVIPFPRTPGNAEF